MRHPQAAQGEAVAEVTDPITPEAIAELERLHAEAFRAPWTYARWEVECGACEGGTNEPETGCTDPDCDGAHVPIVQVDSPDEYPNGQTVAQISVPGLLCLADKNGALIAGMRNALPSLLSAARDRAELVKFLREHGETLVRITQRLMPLKLGAPGVDAHSALHALLERLK